MVMGRAGGSWLLMALTKTNGGSSALFRRGSGSDLRSEVGDDEARDLPSRFCGGCLRNYVCCVREAPERL